MLGAILIAVAAFGVAATLRPQLQTAYAEAKRRHDVYLLPSPEHTRLMSLGYRSALADLVFAHVLVSYGQHFQEKRRFEFVGSYLETMMALDPRFREPYRLADTLLTLQPEPAREEDYRTARRLQERGLEEFPFDSELWLIAGQFSAYLAANQVPESEREEFRLDGARKLARACELVSSNENIPYNCIAAASLFSGAGQAEAAQRFLERVLAVSDDPEIRAIASGYLRHLVGEAERGMAEEHTRRLRDLWSRDLRFVSRERLFVLGPGFDPARCAGLEAREAPECVTSFRAWGETPSDSPHAARP